MKNFNENQKTSLVLKTVAYQHVDMPRPVSFVLCKYTPGIVQYVNTVNKYKEINEVFGIMNSLQSDSSISLLNIYIYMYTHIYQYIHVYMYTHTCICDMHICVEMSLSIK